MTTYNLQFDGSIADQNRARIPHFAGAYLVYRGVFSVKENVFYCKEIMYIGQAQDVGNRIQFHEKRQMFLRQLGYGEVLFYSYAPVNVLDLQKVENALIFHMQPRLNDIGKATFNYPPTRIISRGACALLDSDFTLE